MNEFERAARQMNESGQGEHLGVTLRGGPQHTPGPWRAVKKWDGAIEIHGPQESGVVIATVRIWGDTADGPDPTEGNAHLLAAAPALLRELRLLNLDENGEQKRHTPAGRAIAKAEAA